MLTEESLANFWGSEQWFQHSLMQNMYYTEGVRHVATEGNAYWLLDYIASMQLDPKIRQHEFQSWKLTVDGHKGVLKCSDGNGYVIHTHNLDYTDFPLPSIIIWVSNHTILLPTEY